MHWIHGGTIAAVLAVLLCPESLLAETIRQPTSVLPWLRPASPQISSAILMSGIAPQP
jgi:hypothetical protein